MTLQEIFTKMVLHLRQQKAASRLANGTCAYRGQHNRMCAVGCLITDQAYHDGLEGQGVRAASILEALAASGVKPDTEQLRMLNNLQRMHDNTPPYEWPAMLSYIAKKASLKMPLKVQDE